MQLAGVACCGHGDKTSLFIVRGQKPLTRTERERETFGFTAQSFAARDMCTKISNCAVQNSEKMNGYL